VIEAKKGRAKTSALFIAMNERDAARKEKKKNRLRAPDEKGAQRTEKGGYTCKATIAGQKGL